MQMVTNKNLIRVRLLNFLQSYGLRLILILFFLVSIIGLFRDYSLNTGGDESVLMAATLKMISDHTLRSNYPTFYHVSLGVYFYLLPFILLFTLLLLFGVFTDLNSLREFVIINPYNLLPFARLLTVLMGLVTIYLLFKIAQKLFNNKWISLAAAFFLASSLMFVELAHLARAWLPQTMAVVIAFYLIVILYQRQEDKLKDYLFVGLSLGLALGVHVIGIIVYSSFFIAHYLKSTTKKLKDIFLINKYFWLVNIIIVICYFLIFYLNPYGFKNYINREGKLWPNFSFLFAPGATANVSANNSLFFNVISSFKNFGYFAMTLIEWEPILVLFFIVGAIILFFKERKKFYIIIYFILVYYIGVTFAGRTWYYILPMIPFLALTAGFGLFQLYRMAITKIPKAIVLMLISLILILNITPALAWDYLLIQSSARLEARAWIYNNIASGSKIIDFDPLLALNENQATLMDIKKYASNFYSKKRDYLLVQPAEEYHGPSYYVLNYAYFNNLPDELLNKKYNYLIINWQNSVELKKSLVQAEAMKLKMTLLKRFPETAEENKNYIDIRDLNNPVYYIIVNGGISAPVVDIYKIN